MTEIPKPKSILVTNGPVAELQVGYWNLTHTDACLGLPTEISTQAQSLVTEWANHFAKENTWVQQQLGIPSLIVRLDATRSNGTLQLYEVEERPAGIGATYVLNDDFRARFDQVRQSWPKIQIAVSPSRKPNDDHLWAELKTPETATELVLARVEPEETQYQFLNPRSISSINKKGDKSYGVTMGLWQQVQDPEALNWETAFAIKPMQGSKTKDVHIWHPDKKIPGRATRTKIIDTLAHHPQGMYVQEYYPPMAININGQDLMAIMRIYLAFDLHSHQWVSLGGLWNARSNVKIHGSQDSIFGPIIPT